MTGKFKSLHVDLEKSIFELNGKPMGNNVMQLKLTADNGFWNLKIEKVYSGRAGIAESSESETRFSLRDTASILSDHIHKEE